MSKRETKIAVINSCAIPDEKVFKDLSHNEIKSLAISHPLCKLYSIDDFCRAFNNEDINSERDFIAPIYEYYRTHTKEQ